MGLFSIRYKLSVLLLTAILLPILTSIVITYDYTQSSVKQELIRQNSHLLFQGRMNIQTYLNDIDKLAHTTFYGSNFFETIKRTKYGYVKQLDINDSLQTLGTMVDDFYQVALRIDQDDMTHLYWEDFVKSQRGADIGSRTDATVYIVPTHPSTTFGISEAVLAQSYRSVPVFSYYRVLEDIPLKDRIGVLVIDVKLDYLAMITEMMHSANSDEEVVILDENQNVIYATDGQRIGTRLEDDWVGNLYAQSNPVSHFEVNDDAFRGMIMHESIELPFADWKLVKKIPMEMLNKSAEQLLKINTLVLVVFLAVAALASLIVIYNFMNPIKRLIREIEVVEMRDFRASFPRVKRKDEFGVLFNKFHKMVEHLNQLILQEYRMEIANKTNQLKALQAQINPHFLNNALQSIATLALKDENLKVYSLISAIGKMMHYNMDLKETVVPLSREIDYIRSYLEVQQERFEELHVEISVDPDALKIPIPKMTLQPIVENYFKHGIIEGDARMAITVKMIGKRYLVMSVEDNGAGIPPDQLARLQWELNGEEEYDFSANEHIGLGNVMNRLMLYFNGRVKMVLSHAIPRGLKVMITIQLERGGEKNDESAHRG